MEQETFWTLLKDLPHWEFEIFLMLLFDVVIGLLIWPRVKMFFKHHEEDDEKFTNLERRVKILERTDRK